MNIKRIPGGYIDETGPHRGEPMTVNSLLTGHRELFAAPAFDPENVRRYRGLVFAEDYDALLNLYLELKKEKA